MKVTTFKKFECENCSITKPAKVDKYYTSSILYDSEPLYIQTPEIKLRSTDFYFNVVKKGQFLTVLEDIEKLVISTLSSKSEEFFKGKTFTEEYIKANLEPIYTLTENGDIYVGCSLSNNIKVYDHANNIVTETVIDEPEYNNTTCIINIKNIKFVKAKIQLSIEINRVKLSVTKKKSDECIFEDPVTEAETETDPEPILEESTPDPLEVHAAENDLGDFFEE